MRPGHALGVVVIVASQLVGLEQAQARSVGTVPYPIADVWPSTVRFLRIDRDCTLREKDDAAGYILFDYPEKQKVHKGSVELIRTFDNEGREVTKVIFSLPDLPRHSVPRLASLPTARMRWMGLNAMSLTSAAGKLSIMLLVRTSHKSTPENQSAAANV